MSLSKKIHILIFTLFILFFSFRTFMQWRGIDFPKENELTYSEGILGFQHSVKSRVFLTLNPIEQPTKKIVFGCTYSAYVTVENTECISLSNLKDFVGKKGKIGWYKQNSKMWHENDIPQLVTLDVESKEKISYQDTVAENKKLNLTSFFTLIFVSIFAFLIFKIFYASA